MKTITIYERTILERTVYRKYPYKEVTQISIFYDNKEYKNHGEKIDNLRLKIPFKKVFETNIKASVNHYVGELGRKEYELFEKETLNKILSEVEE